MRANETICNHVTSHPARDRCLCGTFVSSPLQFDRCLWTLVCSWGSVRASGDVSSVQIWTEGMSDPVLDQSSHHSHSVREDKIQTVTSGFCCCCSFCKISNPPRRLCYLCHHAISSMCTSPLADSFFPLAAGWTLNRRSENISVCKPQRRREGETKTGCQSPRVCVCLHIQGCEYVYTDIALGLPNKIGPEVPWDRKELP